jgi:hypothetical protein
MKTGVFEEPDLSSAWAGRLAPTLSERHEISAVIDAIRLNNETEPEWLMVSRNTFSPI